MPTSLSWWQAQGVSDAQMYWHLSRATPQPLEVVFAAHRPSLWPNEAI
jgi:hypothetical protein